MNAVSLIPTIFRSTRIAGCLCTLIDNIFAFNLAEFSSGILTLDLSDLFPLFIMHRNIRQFNPKPPVRINYRIINDSTMDKIYQSFGRNNFGNFVESIECIDIDESINLLNSKKNYIVKT